MVFSSGKEGRSSFCEQKEAKKLSIHWRLAASASALPQGE
jgi:hypothetical protein